MSAHTPGPWLFQTADEHMNDDFSFKRTDLPTDFKGSGYTGNPAIIGANDERVVGCDEYNVFSGPNQSSNVKLILAAPELLAALRAICDSKNETEEYAAIVSAETLMTRIGSST